jgi:lipopolysaccharide/colanic/teichoic acid biosynthesis glycosyltransferase
VGDDEKIWALVVTLIIVPLLVTETSDWMPWIARKLVRRGARALPSQFRQRYTDEWDAELDALPGGKLTKLAFGIRVCLGAPGTGAALRGTSSPRQASVKSLLDPLIALVILMLALPAMAVIAVAIRVTSRGPVIFRQRRVGRDGQMFTLLKFRSMYRGITPSGPATSRDGGRSGSARSRLREDPRITTVGRLLRRYSLDELPQLLNILTGSMSLVGPRPPMVEEAAVYDDELRRRLSVKPGLTGLWQISGRSDLSWQEAVRLDLSYIDDWSLGLDARILTKTAAAVLRGNGAG